MSFSQEIHSGIHSLRGKCQEEESYSRFNSLHMNSCSGVNDSKKIIYQEKTGRGRLLLESVAVVGYDEGFRKRKAVPSFLSGRRRKNQSREEK